jgi:hypothetical protein
MTFHLVGLDVFIGGNFKKDENIFHQNKKSLFTQLACKVKTLMLI